MKWFANRKEGAIALVTTLILMTVMLLVIGMIAKSHLDTTVANNFKKRIQSFYSCDGMITLIAQEIWDKRESLYISTTIYPTGSITVEEWSNPPIGGTAVSDLTSNANYPNNPTSVFTRPIFEFPDHPTTNYKDNYGLRIHGFVHPPQSGNYRFWISSDDNSELWLSTDESPANISRIAYEDSWTDPRVWQDGNERSALISLTKGKRYYIRALMKEGGGGDNLAVGWQLPDGTLERPIPGSRLSPLGSGPTFIKADSARELAKWNIEYYVMQGTTSGSFDVKSLAYEVNPRGGRRFVTTLNQHLARSLTQKLDTITVPITLYDMRCNGSNPEFNIYGGCGGAPFKCQWFKDMGCQNCGSGCGTQTQFIKNADGSKKFASPTRRLLKKRLGPDGLPLRGDSLRYFYNGIATPFYSMQAGILDSVMCYKDSIQFSWCVDTWFRPWVSQGPGTYRMPVYDIRCAARIGSGFDEWGTVVRFTTVNHDTFYKNIEFQDSIKFIKQANGNYRFERSDFRPLAGKGFNDGGWSFTMKMKTQFTYEAGTDRIFRFVGDDDLWVFIDSILIIDLGGLQHSSLTFDMDSVAAIYGWQNGRTYSFDLFFAERQIGGSSVLIETNIGPFIVQKAVRRWKRDYGTLN